MGLELNYSPARFAHRFVTAMIRTRRFCWAHLCLLWVLLFECLAWSVTIQLPRILFPISESLWQKPIGS